jgi:serine/threonine protein phosphatase PrpC
MTQIGSTARHIRIPIPDSGGYVELSWSAHTNTGHRRSHNEDSYVAHAPLFAVADGMGGHAAGDEASAAVVTRLAESIDGDFSQFDEIQRALQHAVIDIRAIAALRNGAGVGTTATGIALTRQNGGLYWAVFNIGDSRVYSLCDGELVQETIDHSAVQVLIDAGEITAEEAESHPHANVITRAVGFGANPIPDLWLIPVYENSRLLVCSDGLTKEVRPELIKLLLEEGTDPDDAAGLLIEAALEAGGRDNITAVVVEVDEYLGGTVPGDGVTEPRFRSTPVVAAGEYHDPFDTVPGLGAADTLPRANASDTVRTVPLNDTMPLLSAVIGGRRGRHTASSDGDAS